MPMHEVGPGLDVDGPALDYESYRIAMTADALADRYLVGSFASLQADWLDGSSVQERDTSEPDGAESTVREPLAPVIMDEAAHEYEQQRVAMAAEKLARELLSSRAARSARDPAASLDALYRRHSAEVRRYVRRTFGAPLHDAEDVVQTVFERYVGEAKARDIENPAAFLIGMAKNHVIDQRRRQGVRARYAADIQETGPSCVVLNAERIVASRQQLALIEGAIATLDARSREMLLMSRIDGLSSAEIARRKDCSPTLVKRIIVRAIERCRSAIGEAGQEFQVLTTDLN